MGLTSEQKLLEEKERELMEEKEKVWGNATTEQKLDFLLSEIKDIQRKSALEQAQKRQLLFLKSRLTEYHPPF